MTSHGKLRKEKGCLAEYETQIKGKRNQFDSGIFSKDVCANTLTTVYGIVCEKHYRVYRIALYSLMARRLILINWNGNSSVPLLLKGARYVLQFLS